MNTLAETELFHEAINHWWKSKREAQARTAARDAAKAAGKKSKQQGGTRDANTHGKTMDEFAETLRRFLIDWGVKSEHIFSGGHLTTAPAILPSYFRPSKNWDLIVLGNSRFHPAPDDAGDPVLYAAVEFKSQDKSIGNNQNNRLEESIGNAHDFWVTYAHSGFARQQPRPWLGYLFVGKHERASDDETVEVKQPHFLVTPPFRRSGSDETRCFDGPSYFERYQIFMRQIVGARLYDAGAFIVTDESMATEKTNYRIPLPEFGPANFLRGLKAQILAHYPGAHLR